MSATPATTDPGNSAETTAVGAFSAVWWSTHIPAIVAAVIAIITTLRPNWAHVTSTGQAVVTPIALVTAIGSIATYLSFVASHHKLIAPASAITTVIAEPITTVLAPIVARPAEPVVPTVVVPTVEPVPAGRPPFGTGVKDIGIVAL